MQRTRRSASLLISSLVALAIAFTSAAPAHAAPGRSNGESTVIFVHGYLPDGKTNCNADYFKKARDHFKGSDWDGALRTFGYYAADEGCDYEYGGTRNTSLNTVAKALAQRIHRSFSANNKKVDIVAHSMGGLIVRTMLRHVALKGGTDGWPRRLYIEDVVTLGTPHDGTSWAESCDGYRQCRQMEPGSDFIRSLGEGLYQSHMGTDWTLISSFDDWVVSEGSGVGANSQHKIQYRNLPNDGFGTGDHNSLRNVSTGLHTARIKHSMWSAYTGISSPVARARLAVYLHSAN
ncbi:triacylglycerol lipase [Streptomyces sp. NL15-2K]|uniref:esterase/lipase family protein n=1 Tax=Streptomyces sp. NL15-2K TaxID=376149 RepID=UPI000F57FC62|nr:MULTISPECIES: alpha/beta hydrolase [Actinomycetes]WKX09523.1 alpha/beta hydrolase [Kutzneria buriramensis]GCB48965.1 hypothetical protein SNL152K_6295 [Streptomyces sp. NL15-2K]